LSTKYIVVTKFFKSAELHCPNYILNDPLSNLMVNKKAEQKNIMIFVL
jgi:hypothetical protein